MLIKKRFYIEQITKYNEEGYSPIQMEKLIPVDHTTIKKWLVEINLKENKFNRELDKKHEIEFSESKFLELCSQGLTDLEIGVKMYLSRRRVCRLRNSYNIAKNIDSVKKKTKEEIQLSYFAESALIGCILGDGYLHRCENHNAKGRICQGIKQEAYLKHKYELFKEIANENFKFDKIRLTDRKTGIVKIHKSISFSFLSNGYLNKFYDNIYIDNVKKITDFAIEKYNEISLAYHFMDDGCKSKSGFKLCTYGFELEDIKKLSNHLRNNFDLKTTIQKSKCIYIKKESAETFINIVGKYIVPTLKYKINK
jgi:hypothetical protein